MLIAQHSTAVAAGRYVHWGVIQISLANLLIIVGMVALFIAALLLPFPGSHVHDASEEGFDERE